MPYFVRPRGVRFELRVKDPQLAKPFYATFDDAAQAQGYGEQLVAMLARGVVPVDLQAQEETGAVDVPVMQLVRGYLKAAAHLTPSDDKLLATMLDELASVKLSGVTYRWVEGWVAQLKARRLAPGTIRKRVGALARVMDWHLANVTPADQPKPVNVLRLLPRGYSQYTVSDQRELAKKGVQAPQDVQRDRRLLPEEEQRILRVLGGWKREDRERPWAEGGDADLADFIALLIDTGLRLREAYRLRVDQVDLQRGVLRVEGTKVARGQSRPRTVPLRPHLRQMLARRCKGRVGLLWAYWDTTPEDLDACSRRLSARFASLFGYAEVPDFKEHDLRHEAACRWFELRDAGGRWIFSDVEICRIMGWTSLAMALRYASLRGEDLAARLG